MKYGLYLANYGAEHSARALADLAREAEEAGWDGFFLWDHILASRSQKLNVLDPWVTLTAMAMTTERIRLGTTLTPLPRRRPWVLARQTASLDQLSNGRLVLSVGLGFPPDTEFEYFGESGDLKTRAEMLDEGLQVLTGLWKGKALSFQGKYYQLQKMTFLPTPLQKPRIPIWVGGFWRNPAPFRRAARWDGVLPLSEKGLVSPDELVEILDFIRKERTKKEPFDAVVIGSRHIKGPRKLIGAGKVALYAEAGATWWLESLYLERNSIAEIRKSILLGPPRI